MNHPKPSTGAASGAPGAFFGRKSGARKPKMIKSQGIRCALCGRALARAAALMRGQPVGPSCAVEAGLIEPRQGAGKVTRDNRTMDLFGHA